MDRAPVEPVVEDDEHLIDAAEDVATLIDTLVEVIWIELRRLRAFLPAIDVISGVAALHARLLCDHRSLIRLLGSHLIPYQPTARFFIQMPVCSPSDAFQQTQDNRAQAPSLLDVLQVDEDICPVPNVRNRCEYYGAPMSPDVSMYGEKRWDNQRVSTPVTGGFMAAQHFTFDANRGDGTSFFTAGEQDQTQRIAVLESELEKLRQQMAMIVQLKEKQLPAQPDVLSLGGSALRPQSPDGSTDSGVDDNDMQEVKQSDSVFSMGTGAVPPPPPPPPPSLLRATPIAMRARPKTDRAERPQQTVTLTDVLKELHTVKLRHVHREKSPGGTPRRNRFAVNDPSPDDPGAYLAAALKRKFAKVAEDSPQSERDTAINNSWDSTPEPSPLMPPKKGRRRSKLASLDLN